MATIISLQDIHLSFGHHPLLDQANLIIEEGERIGLIGRNGAGKSSLLKLLDGRLQPDGGKIHVTDGLFVATVEQEPELPGETVFDSLVQFAQRGIARESWEIETAANQWAHRLGLNPQAPSNTLSGGMRKRVALAGALIQEPGLLLLDEPTNHLDLDGIAWLENILKNWRHSVIIITHDRAFLDQVTTRIVELDRGLLHSFPGSFSQWQTHKQEWLHAEALENQRFDKLLAQEEVWIRKGIEARRTRNEGRVRRLEQLRRERAQRREHQGQVRFTLEQARKSGKLVAELEDVNLAFDGRPIVKDFSATIIRGDKIGLIGPNGAGKTTLLQLILGQLKPNSGTVRHGTNLEIAYFDQMRADLNEDDTLMDAISPGNQWIEIGQQKKHVIGYLGDFLFEPARTQSPVRTLSGGERARLLLARLFAQPANILVLDEPTNDLDIETLELLESLLQEFPATVLLVSHDRVFLDNVVTQTIAYEGDAHWKTYVGGYTDWLEQKPAVQPTVSATQSQEDKVSTKSSKNETSSSSTRETTRRPSRLAPWEVKELAELPEQIQTQEESHAKLVEQLADPSLYQGDPQALPKLQKDIEASQAALDALYARWELLESRQDVD